MVFFPEPSVRVFAPERACLGGFGLAFRAGTTPAESTAAAPNIDPLFKKSRRLFSLMLTLFVWESEIAVRSLSETHATIVILGMNASLLCSIHAIVHAEHAKLTCRTVNEHGVVSQTVGSGWGDSPIDG